MIKLSPQKQKQFALTLLSTGLAIFASWYFLVQSQATIEKRNRSEVVDLNNKISKQKTAIETEKNNRENAKVYQKFIAEIEDRLPKGNVETWLTEKISDMATRHKLLIGGTMLQPMKEASDYRFKGTPYRLHGFQFEFQGDLNQIGKFVMDLENGMPMAEVDGLVLTAGTGAEKNVHGVTMKISMASK